MSAGPEALAKPGGHQRQLFVTDAVTDRELAVGEVARQEAEGVAHLAATLDGNDVVSLNDLAWLLAEIRNKPDEALPLAEKAEKLAPQLGWVTDTLGWIYYRRGAYAEAEKILLRAAEHAPANGLVQFHLGLTYEKLGRKTDAASALRQAAKLDPKLAEREKVEQRIKGLEG